MNVSDNPDKKESCVDKRRAFFLVFRLPRGKVPVVESSGNASRTTGAAIRTNDEEAGPKNAWQAAKYVQTRLRSCGVVG
jgi:hypothetical protein